MFREYGGGAGRGNGFRGRRSGGCGGSSGKGFNGGRGGNRGNFDQGPPERLILLGSFSYPCEDDIVCKVEIDDVPYFNTPIYLENKEQIGKIEEIFGTVRDYSVSVKLSDNIKATNFKVRQKLFIDPQKLLPIARFLPQTKVTKRKGPAGVVSGKRGVGRRSVGYGGGGNNLRGGYNRGAGGNGGSCSFNRGGRGSGAKWSKGSRSGGNGRGRW